jgi:hypothetical protein
VSFALADKEFKPHLVGSELETSYC